MNLSWSGQARYLDSLVQSGGYLYPRKKRRWFEDLPTPEQIEDERIALGILPKRTKKIVEETVDKATEDVSREQANILATAYLEEEQQRKLMDRLRNKVADSNLKWRDEMFTITLTMILDALQKKADLDVLDRMMAEQETAEAEATEVLEVFMEI